MRVTSFDHREQDMAAYIREQLTTLLRLSRSTLQYVVSGVQTCKDGWTWAHGFSVGTCNRVHAEYNRWWQQAQPSTTELVHVQTKLNTDGVTATADKWLLTWLVQATHNPPNGGNPSVPKLGASILYPQYIRWCQQANQVPLQRDGFRGRLSIMKRSLEVVSRASKQGSTECGVCSVLKRAEHSTVSLSLKREIKELLGKHIEFTNCEVAEYMKHGFEAKDNPQVFLFLVAYVVHKCICIRHMIFQQYVVNRSCPWQWTVPIRAHMTFQR